MKTNEPTNLEIAEGEVAKIKNTFERPRGFFSPTTAVEAHRYFQSEMRRVFDQHSSSTHSGSLGDYLHGKLSIAAKEWRKKMEGEFMLNESASKRRFEASVGGRSLGKTGRYPLPEDNLEFQRILPAQIHSLRMNLTFTNDKKEDKPETHIDAYGIERCSKTLMRADSDGVGVTFSSIRDSVRDLDGI